MFFLLLASSGFFIMMGLPSYDGTPVNERLCFAIAKDPSSKSRREVPVMGASLLA